MGLFDFFKRTRKESNAAVHAQKNIEQKQNEPAIPESEKQYYRPDEYYTDVAFAGTSLERKVITFQERKLTAFPSRRGLYPAEILLLYYCDAYRTYPHPKSGYPGFWWFEYGIRNVGAALERLETNGFIMLNEKGKYVLTDIGRMELEENSYVPYMHKTKDKTTEDTRYGLRFNVWSVNEALGNGDKSAWKDVVDMQLAMKEKEMVTRVKVRDQWLEKNDPDLSKKLQAQDKQLAKVQEARAQYEDSQDLDAYISFRESLWTNGGLLFRGARWHFELADLYIKAKRYVDALRFVQWIKNNRSDYTEKAEKYEARIKKLMK